MAASYQHWPPLRPPTHSQWRAFRIAHRDRTARKLRKHCLARIPCCRGRIYKFAGWMSVPAEIILQIDRVRSESPFSDANRTRVGGNHAFAAFREFAAGNCILISLMGKSGPADHFRRFLARRHLHSPQFLVAISWEVIIQQSSDPKLLGASALPAVLIFTRSVHIGREIRNKGSPLRTEV